MATKVGRTESKVKRCINWMASAAKYVDKVVLLLLLQLFIRLLYSNDNNNDSNTRDDNDNDNNIATLVGQEHSPAPGRGRLTR